MSTASTRLLQNRKIVLAGVSAAIIAFIFFPYPLGEAVQVNVTKLNDVVFGDGDTSDVEVNLIVNNPALSGITFPGSGNPDGTDQEHIPVILEVVVKNSAGTTVASGTYDILGRSITGTSTIKSISPTFVNGGYNISPYGTYASAPGYNYFYGYGYAYVNNLPYNGYYTIGYGDYIYGATGPAHIKYVIDLDPNALGSGTYTVHARIKNNVSGISDNFFVSPETSFSSTVPESAYSSGVSLTLNGLSSTVVLPSSASNPITRLNIVFGTAQSGAAGTITTLAKSALTALGTSVSGGTITFAGGGFDLDLGGICTVASPCTISVGYDQTALEDAGINENEVRLYHFTGGAWTDVTTSRDTTANTVTGVFTSLSPGGLGKTTSSGGGEGPSSSGTSSGGGGGGGGGATAASIKNAKNAPVLYNVSWDCEANSASIVVGPASASVGVKVRTDDGVVKTTKAAEQPYSSKLLFTAPMDSETTFISVEVINTATPLIPSVKKTVNISDCKGSVTVTSDAPVPVTTTTKPKLTTGEEKTFEATYNAIATDIVYTMDGKITSVQVDEDNKSVTFNLANVKEGTLEIALPHSFIYAADGQYLVMVDGEAIDYEVVDSTNGVTVLSIQLPEGAEVLSISGTSVVPEFGLMAMVILAVSIVSIVALTRTKRLAITPL